MDNETVSKVVEEYNNIHSVRELSRRFKIDKAKIRMILRDNGIEIKDSRSALIAMNIIKEKSKITLSSNEKAYLYGLVLGDLTPVRKSNYTLKLITHSTHKTFMDLLYRTFEKYGVTSYKETKNKDMYRFHTHIDLDSFSFLLNSKDGVIPDWITSENFFDFLAGFVDSDGSVILRKSGKYFQFVIRFFGQNLNLLNEIKGRLETLGYDLSIHKSHSKGDVSYHKGIKFEYNKDYYT